MTSLRFQIQLKVWKASCFFSVITLIILSVLGTQFRMEFFGAAWGCSYKSCNDEAWNRYTLPKQHPKICKSCGTCL